MKVIVAGISKTGTKSMAAALQELGYNVYDFMEHFLYHGKDWNKILREGGTTEDFRRMYAHVDAVSDLPAAYFWDEIHAAYPDAKIILMMRGDEDTWCDSFVGQMNYADKYWIYNTFCHIFSPSSRSLNKFSAKAIESAFSWNIFSAFGANSPNSMMFKMKYRRHNAHVLQNAPKEKLLVFSVKEGWEPLCKFLDKPVPSKPFPHKNVKASVVEEIYQHPHLIKARNEAIIRGSLFTSLLLYGSYKLATGSGPKSWMLFWLNCGKNVFSSLTSVVR